MLKKSFLAVFGLLLAMAFVSPSKASAEVAIGVTIGGPIYARPVYPYAYAYVAPRPYVYPRAYYYDRPYWRHERFERHEYYEHRYDRDRYDHDRYDRDRYRRDWR